MCGQSDHSTSQHSSTGPSNNTGSTNLSNQPGNPFHGQEDRGGDYSRPFEHIPAGGPMSLTVQMGGGPGGGPHTQLVGQVGPYHGHSNSSGSNLYTPVNGMRTKPAYVSTGPHSVASLQMV